MHPYMHFLGLEVLSYNVIVSVAATLGFFYFSRALWKLNIPPWQIVAFVFLGFAIGYFKEYMLPLWLSRPALEALYSAPYKYFYGWAFLIIVLAIVCIRVFKWPAMKVLDQGSVAVMMTSSIARIGCYLNGCCYGRSCDLPWAMVFPGHPEVRVHPAQIYMFLLESALWIYLFYFDRKWKRFDGQTFWVGMLLYSVYKFSIEFVRTNTVFMFGLTHAQIFTIFTLALSLRMLRFHGNKSSKLSNKSPKVS